MKIKTIVSAALAATLVLTAGTSLAAPLRPTPKKPAKESTESKPKVRRNLWYVSLGGGALSADEDPDFAPSVTLGKRFENGSTAVDVSMKFMGLEGLDYDDGDATFIAVPRIMMLSFLDGSADSSLYFGGGLSYGHMDNERSGQEFSGLMADAAIGYEFGRHSRIRTIVQVEASQGFLPTQAGAKLPDPAVSLSFGIGF